MPRRRPTPVVVAGELDITTATNLIRRLLRSGPRTRNGWSSTSAGWSLSMSRAPGGLLGGTPGPGATRARHEHADPAATARREPGADRFRSIAAWPPEQRL